MEVYEGQTITFILKNGEKKAIITFAFWNFYRFWNFLDDFISFAFFSIFVTFFFLCC